MMLDLGCLDAMPALVWLSKFCPTIPPLLSTAVKPSLPGRTGMPEFALDLRQGSQDLRAALEGGLGSGRCRVCTSAGQVRQV